MTITYVGIGALSSGASSATPALPGGLVAGDLMVLAIGSASPTESTPSLPAGWDIEDTFSGGGGAFGSGTGPRRLTWYTRRYQVGDTAPATAIPSASGTCIAARILGLHSSIGLGWRWQSSISEMTVAVTGFAVTGASPETFSTNDFAILGYNLRSNVPTVSAEGASAAGITFGTRTQRASDSIATGNLERFDLATCAITTGIANTQFFPGITATLSAAHTGVGGMLRIREATSSITASVQTSSPPRNLVSVTGMTGEDIVSATIERITGSVYELLRGAVDVDVTGQNALVRTDGEMSFGSYVNYRATLSDALGGTWYLISNSIINQITNEVLSDATLAIGVACQIMEWKEKRYARESSEFNVSGRIVVVSGPQPDPSSTITLFTQTTAERDAMIALLKNATNGIVQIRTHAVSICIDDPGFDSHAQVDSYLQIKSNVVERAAKFRYPQRIWAIDVVETEPWPLAIEARGFTLDDIDAYYSGRTYSALKADFASWLAVAQFNWST